MIRAFPVKLNKLSGTSYSEVYKKAFAVYADIKKQSKRRVYVRSAYFNKEKVFLGLFWHHMYEKFSVNDKIRRLKYFVCAIELIKESHFDPMSKENVDKRSEILHRFVGITKDKELFFVQIKENKNTGAKYLISTFPYDK